MATGDPRFATALRKGLRLRHGVELSPSDVASLEVEFYHRMNIADTAYHSVYYREPHAAPPSLVSATATGTRANSTVVAFLNPDQWDAEPTGHINEDGTMEYRTCEEATGEIQTFAIVPLPAHQMHCNHVTCRNDPMPGHFDRGQWRCKKHDLRYRCCAGNPDKEGNFEVVAFLARLRCVSVVEDYPRMYRMDRPDRQKLETIDVDRHFRRKLHFMDDPTRPERIREINTGRAEARRRQQCGPPPPRRRGETDAAYAARMSKRQQSARPMPLRGVTFVAELAAEAVNE